jgi:hypothetical protein
VCDILFNTDVRDVTSHLNIAAVDVINRTRPARLTILSRVLEPTLGGGRMLVASAGWRTGSRVRQRHWR